MKYIKTFESESYTEDKLRKKFEDELSKYLTRTLSEDFVYSKKERTYGQDYFDPSSSTDTIFLLGDDYGARIKFIAYTPQFREYTVKINSIKKTNSINQYTSKKKFRDGNLEASWNSYEKISIEDVVKDFVNNLKKTNDIRKKIKDIIELKKSIKKYNL